MQTTDVALARAIAGGMAVYTARMGQHLAGFAEQGRGRGGHRDREQSRGGR
jgi:hypothetical protein